MQLVAACNSGGNAALFTQLPEDGTGIHFRNSLTETDSLNALSFPNMYHGSGIGIGDFNNDGLPDIFFGANMESSRIYLNKGKLSFEDITVAAGLTTHQWISGVSVIDINNDGWKDLYLSVIAIGKSAAHNLLFVNQGADETGRPKFIEMATAYGLNFSGSATQSAFFDYDLDGDLDMFLLTNGIAAANENFIIRPKRLHVESKTGDLLFRNEGGPLHPYFTDVTAAAGLGAEGFGLGVAISDLNRDGLPDIYVSNDYISSDQLWMNNGNGTFTDHNNDYLQHTSLNGMGVDIADINNDGWSDLLQLDMLPADNFGRKMMLTKPDYNSFRRKKDMDYQSQFVRNSMQLNNGPGPDSALHFSEIANLSGLAATDWSWAALITDFDNDGWKDIFISNGYRRNITDLDFIVNDYQSKNRFGSADYKKSRYREQLASIPEIKITDLFYHNNQNLTFSDSSRQWGISQPSFSTGAAYADLDNDGDPDLVVNLIDAPAMVYRNNSSRHSLQLRLQGDSQNTGGIGAMIEVHAGGQTLFYEHFLTRGYLSSVDEKIIIGTGNSTLADSLRITWPGGRTQLISNLQTDSIIQLKQADAKSFLEQTALQNRRRIQPLLQDATILSGINYRHSETEYLEFDHNALVPYNLSVNGPALATGDLDGDGLEDVFIGGSSQGPRYFLYQQPNGSFKTVPLPAALNQEDAAAILIDIDNDKDLDLCLVSGSTKFPAGAANYQDRIFLNEGVKGFVEKTDLLPSEHFSGASITASDYDGDGDLDLFIGAGYLPGSYPFADRNMLVRNDGGKFTDITDQYAKELLAAGPVLSAAWADMDKDGDPDLITAGPFEAIDIFLNEKGKLKKSTATGDLNQTGWWTAIAVADLDGDGDADLVAGNLGTNTHFKASADEPLRLFAKDFDKNGSVDPVIGIFSPDKEGKRRLFPEVVRDQFVQQLPSYRKNFERYETFANADIPTIFGDNLKDAYQRKITTLGSTWFENTGNGKFIAHPLPPEAQFAPMHSILLTDLNNDHLPDILAGGNEYSWDSRNGYTDASYGFTGINTKSGGFKSLPASSSGFWVKGDLRSIRKIKARNGTAIYLAAVNQGFFRVFKEL